MKPPERLPADDPLEWLNHARSNLALARNRVPGVYLEHLCFEAQQAAEKAIKALMMRRGIWFPYVHDLGALLSLLEEAGETIPPAVDEARKLTPYAATTRYPGVAQRMNEETYAEAVELAELVVRWVEDRLTR